MTLRRAWMTTIFSSGLLLNPSSIFSSPTDKLLHDFQKGSLAARPSPSEAQTALQALFPKRLSRLDQCKDGWAAEEADEARKSGHIVADVLSKAQGSFTARGQQETAYLVSLSTCLIMPSPSTILFVMRNGASVLEADVEAFSLEAIPDINQDGITELLLIGGGTGQGNSETTAKLVQFQGKELVTLRDFGIVAEESCGAVSDKKVKSSTIYYRTTVQGQKLDFDIKEHHASCLGGVK